MLSLLRWSHLLRLIQKVSKIIIKYYETDQTKRNILVIKLYMLQFLSDLYEYVDEPERLYSLLGVVIILLIGFLFSAHPGHVKWRNVLWGVGLQFTLGLLVLRWDVCIFTAKTTKDR